MQRIDALKGIAYNLGDLIIAAQPASLTGSTLQFDALIHPLSQQLQGFYGYLYSGAGAGQERVVGSFNPSTNELVFPQVFASIPSTNSQFILTEQFPKSEYDQAIDRYIGKARIQNLQDKVATLALVATQYAYPVPSGLEWISTLRFVPSTATDYAEYDDVRRVFEIPPRYFRLEANPGGSYIIVIDPRLINLDNFDGQLCEIKGQAKPDINPTDNAVLPSDLEEYIITGASMLMASKRISESQEWRIKFAMFKDDLRPLEDYIFKYGRGKKVKT